VIARSSSFRFRSERIDVQQTARALGARVLVLLSMAQAGGQLRVTVDLVESDGTQVWGTQHNAEPSGLVGMEANISREIAQRIGSKLSELEMARLARATKVKPEAYELLLRARYHLRLYTPESRKRAAGYYEQALALEPGFALAHAELATLYRLLSGSADLSARETMPQAEAAARRALAADGDLAEAHSALADIKKDQWDWTTAESEYRRALELNPNLVSARLGYAILLGVRGRHEAAISEIRRARELDPLGLPTAVHAGAVYYNARRFPDALAALNRAADLDPNAPAAWSWMGMVHGAAGQYADAVKAFEKAVALGDTSAASQCYYSFSLARSGRRTEALEVLEHLRRSQDFVPPSSLGIVYLGLNQRDEAIRALQAAYDARDPLLQYLKVEPHFDDLANDPFFRDLTEKIGLPR
jgi:tetratricopeptide (TPR) repeat protein